jgi:hypothetical protein
VYFHVDLLDYYRGDMPPGKVGRLMSMLPQGSATQAVLIARDAGHPDEWRAYYGHDRHARIAVAAAGLTLQESDKRSWFESWIPPVRDEWTFGGARGPWDS